MKKTITQTDVLYFLPEHRDLVHLMPIFNALYNVIEKRDKMFPVTDRGICTNMYKVPLYLTQENIEHLLRFFTKLGCYTSNGKNYDHLISENKEATTVNQDNYEIPNRVLINRVGENKLKVIKLIQEMLHCNLMEAKRMTDNCPITIIFDEYNIDKDDRIKFAQALMDLEADILLFYI